MGHDAIRGGEDQVTELSRGQQIHDPFLDFIVCDIEAGANHSALVEAAVQLHHNLVCAVVVDNFEFPNVTYTEWMCVCVSE